MARRAVAARGRSTHPVARELRARGRRAARDARVVGDKTVEGTKKAGKAVGTGLEKAGEGLSGAGETVTDQSQ